MCLSELLNKIRRTGEGSNPPKSKRVYIKWKRTCPIDHKYKILAADTGGAARLIQFLRYELNRARITEVAIALYFNEQPNCNRYLETVEECTFKIYSPKSNLVTDDTKL